MKNSFAQRGFSGDRGELPFSLYTSNLTQR